MSAAVAFSLKNVLCSLFCCQIDILRALSRTLLTYTGRAFSSSENCQAIPSAIAYLVRPMKRIVGTRRSEGLTESEQSASKVHETFKSSEETQAVAAWVTPIDGISVREGIRRPGHIDQRIDAQKLPRCRVVVAVYQ